MTKQIVLIKKYSTWYNFFVSIFLLTLYSCVSDDSFFSEQTDSKDIVSTTGIVSLLNDINTKKELSSEDELCFQFQYPITLGYNTNAVITIDSYTGLLEVLGAQSSNFYVTGVRFPVQVIMQGQDTSIALADEQALLELLEKCNISTFRKSFDLLFGNCFNLKYPVSLNSKKEENIVRVKNNQELTQFLKAQGENYQPNFEFPIRLNTASNANDTIINTYFDFYNILNHCEQCIDIGFDARAKDDNVYDFVIDFEMKEGYELSFEIDNKVITDIALKDHTFTRKFDYGTYEVCIKLKTPSCPQSIVSCKTIEIEPICPALNFDYSKEPESQIYNFVADFPDIDTTRYDWIVDGELVRENDGGSNGINAIEYQFGIGIHKVCIKSITPTCPDGIEVCKEINACPELYFNAEMVGDGEFSYQFYANFIGIENITYKWLVDNVEKEQDGGTEGDNIFYYNFEPSGTGVSIDYEVCIIAELEECQELKYCTTITVPLIGE